MNSKLRQKGKKKLRNNFSSWWIMQFLDAVFGKTKENVRKHRSIKPVTTGRRGNLVSEQNYDTTSSSQTMY